MTNKPKTDKVIKYSSLCILVIQNTSLVLFMKFALSGNRTKFLKGISVFFTEIVKCLASIALVMYEERSVIKGAQVIYDQMVNKWRDALKVLIPAVVYAVQNILLYVAVDNLPAATYMVTYQLKILTTAFFTVAVLKRKLSIQQWVALLFLFGGICIVQYDQKESENRQKALAAQAMTTLSPLGLNGTDISTTMAPIVVDDKNSLVGLIAVLIACFMSGFAGIYFEKILKGSDVSIWIRNIQLALPSIVFCFLLTLVKDNEEVFVDGAAPSAIWASMLRGFDWAVWTTVFISALGGLVVAVVIKFADNILKGFATSIAIVLNCILAYFLFNFIPSMLFLIGAALVVGAVIVYGIFPYRARHQPLPTTDEEAAKKLADPSEEEATELKVINGSSEATSTKQS